MAELENELTVLRQIHKEIQKMNDKMGQGISQVGENELVVSELEHLEEDAKVFKLIGPVLVQQDLVEVKANVTTRIDFIKKDVARTEKVIDGLQNRAEEQRQKYLALKQAATGGAVKD
ncbi:Prefoldin [Pavlovales sp. CCMP2436]|nr:Prefoldin [Pavlovales sp. CCMP2436]